CALGLMWRRWDLDTGADIAEQARLHVGPIDIVKRAMARLEIRRSGYLNDGRLVVGTDERALPVRMPVGETSGSHTLIVGATGSGKTVTEAWIASRLIE